MRNEAEIIEFLRKRLGKGSGRAHRSARSEWLPVGSGDDAAVIHLKRLPSRANSPFSRDLVLSCDSFLEGVHFLPALHSPDVIGYKALARATSDLAAMGARPEFFMMTLAIPPRSSSEWLERFSAGLARAAGEFKMELIGGDTSAFGTIAIGITVAGSLRSKHALTRSGARPGDQIFVSGRLGGAQFAFECLSARPKIPTSKVPAGSLERHLRPRIQLALGQWLAGEKPMGRKIASAAIDTSDGLSTDLNHLCKASAVGARVFASYVPTIVIPRMNTRRRNLPRRDPLELALHGGEDYELLFTVPPSAAAQMPVSYRGVPLTHIGEIFARSRDSKHSAIELVDAAGRAQCLESRGWDSFRRDR